MADNWHEVQADRRGSQACRRTVHGRTNATVRVVDCFLSKMGVGVRQDGAYERHYRNCGEYGNQAVSGGPMHLL